MYDWKDIPLGNKVWYSIQWFVKWQYEHFRKTFCHKDWKIISMAINVLKTETEVSYTVVHHPTHIYLPSKSFTEDYARKSGWVMIRYWMCENKAEVNAHTFQMLLKIERKVKHCMVVIRRYKERRLHQLEHHINIIWGTTTRNISFSLVRKTHTKICGGHTKTKSPAKVWQKIVIVNGQHAYGPIISSRHDNNISWHYWVCLGTLFLPYRLLRRITAAHLTWSTPTKNEDNNSHPQARSNIHYTKWNPLATTLPGG